MRIDEVEPWEAEYIIRRSILFSLIFRIFPLRICSYRRLVSGEGSMPSSLDRISRQTWYWRRATVR